MFTSILKKSSSYINVRKATMNNDLIETPEKPKSIAKSPITNLSSYSPEKYTKSKEVSPLRAFA